MPSISKVSILVLHEEGHSDSGVELLNVGGLLASDVDDQVYFIACKQLNLSEQSNDPFALDLLPPKALPSN